MGQHPHLSPLDAWELLSAIVAIGVPLTVLVMPTFIGWRRLAQIYPDRPFATDRHFRGVEGRLAGFLGIRGITIAIGPDGFRIASGFPFSRILPPLMIPWSEVVECTQTQPNSIWGATIKLRLRLSDEKIRLYPKIWRNEALPQALRAQLCAET
jgi:hypothetical protein